MNFLGLKKISLFICKTEQLSNIRDYVRLFNFIKEKLLLFFTGIKEILNARIKSARNHPWPETVKRNH